MKKKICLLCLCICISFSACGTAITESEHASQETEQSMPREDELAGATEQSLPQEDKLTEPDTGDDAVGSTGMISPDDEMAFIDNMK